MIKNECGHAYKLLDHAECLWCENCVEKLIERLAKKPGVTEEELFGIKAQEYERGLKDAQPAVDEGFVNTWANDFATATLADKTMHKRIIYMLKEAGVEVVEK